MVGWIGLFCGGRWGFKIGYKISKCGILHGLMLFIVECRRRNGISVVLNLQEIILQIVFC